MSKQKTIATIAIPLPIDKQFDYSIPGKLVGKIVPGVRVNVIFNRRSVVGYVTGLHSRTVKIKLNPILHMIDRTPIISTTQMKLANKIGDYYVSTYGEILDAMLPTAIKHSKEVNAVSCKKASNSSKKTPSLLYIQSLSDSLLHDFYKDTIAEKIKKNQKIVFVVPEVRMIKPMHDHFNTIKGIRIGVWHGRISKKEMISLWQALARNEINLLIGTRSSILAPMLNPGLIVIYDENDPSHKEDQAPYYHAATVALFRAEIERCDVILSSVMPSSKIYSLIKNKKLKQKIIENKNGLAKIVFTGINYQDKIDIMLEREIGLALEKKEKILIFHNRRGFATYLFCTRCKKALMCDRCNSNLHYDFAKKQLFCPSCNYRLAMKELCPNCNASYVKFKGLGIEKLASNLKRIFPNAQIVATKNISSLENDTDSFDIIISTSKSPHLTNFNPDVTVMWDADALFNRGDYNAAENTFGLLSSFLCNTKKNLIVCTGLQKDFYVYKSLHTINIRDFYANEFKARRELKLPPFFHFGLISMRGFNEKNVEKASEKLYDSFKNKPQNGIQISDPSDNLRSRLRGKHYRYALIKSKEVKTLNQAIRSIFKKTRMSGVIITANIDPE